MINTPSRILFVLPSFVGGGAERVTITLLRYLDSSKFNASLIVFNNHGPLVTMVPEGIPVTDLKKPRLRHALGSLITVIRNTQPDFIFSTLGYVNLALLAMRPLYSRKTRVLIREANMPSLSLPNTPLPTIFRVAQRLLYPQANAVICTSSQMMREMRQNFGVHPKSLFKILNPIDEILIRRAATPIVRIKGEGLRLVSAGRLTPQKGFDRLINMMNALDQNTHLTILGEGPEQAALKNKVRLSGLEKQVQFLGFRTNPWSYYAGADALVIASRWEGLPNTALEALACGTPVIATPESGGISDIASAARDGSVTIAEEGQAFISALKSISPNSLLNSTPNPSLLPKQYNAHIVAREFNNLLTRAFG